MKGFEPQHSIRNVVFAGCTVGDKSISSIDDITTNKFVYDVRFLAHVNDLKPEPVPCSGLAHRSPAANSPNELLIDDSDKDKFRAYGFTQQIGIADAHGNSASTGQVIDKFGQYAAAVYSPSIEGRYDIYAYWGSFDQKDAASPWIVHYRDGYSRVYLDQNNTPGWHHLGTFDLDTNSSVRLVYPNYFRPTHLPVVADALRFVKVSSTATKANR